MFKPSKHEVIHLLWFKNIQLRNSQQNLNLKSTNPTKTRNFFLCVSTNTDINKLNWNHKPGLLLYAIMRMKWIVRWAFSKPLHSESRRNSRESATELLNNWAASRTFILFLWNDTHGYLISYCQISALHFIALGAKAQNTSTRLICFVHRWSILNDIMRSLPTLADDIRQEWNKHPNDNYRKKTYPICAQLIFQACILKMSSR